MRSVTRVRCSAIVAVVTLMMPATARAQFGIPQVVIDPTAIAKLASQLSQQVQQITLAKNQLQTQIANMQKLGSPSWRTISGTVARVDALTRQGQAISYSLASLGAQFQQTFPGTIAGGRMNAALAGQLRVQDQRTLATLRGLLDAAQATSQQISTGVARLNAMKTQIGSIQGAQQAAEFNGVVGIHTAEEVTLLRQQLMAQASAQAVLQANQMNRDLQGAAVGRDLWQPGAAVVVRQKDMRVQAVGY